MTVAVECRVNGEIVQAGCTSELIFTVPALIARLSSVLTLYPGDLIFTGTPPGVGAARNPPRWLQAGDVIESHIEALGKLRNRLI